MSDRERIQAVLGDARRRLETAREALARIRAGDGAVEESRAIGDELRVLAERLEELGGLLSPQAQTTPAAGDPARPAADLFSLEDQHAVSKLMQDTAVHLSVRREPGFWEIRHRHTADGRPCEPLRARSIAEAYALYERDAIRKRSSAPTTPRPLTAEEQRALAEFRDIEIDNPRSIRWEKTKTEVDYLDRSGELAGGNRDAVEFPPGELIGPVEHLKSVLGLHAERDR